MQQDLETIGSRLRFLRKSIGLSQGEMAEKLDLSTSTYKNYELNKTPIPHTVLKKIENETKTSLDFLVNGKDLLKDRNETILNIRHNTQFETKIDNGDMVITARIPLFKYIGA